MNKLSALLLIVTCPLLANVEMTTQPRDLFFRGDPEQAGSLQFTVSDDDFREASEMEPIFIRMTLGRNGVFKTTIVNLGSKDPSINRPIYLPIRALNNTGYTVSAPGDSVSIVRWVAGEHHVWIRILRSGDLWVNNGGVVGSPSETTPVAFGFGLSARASDETNDMAGGLANLPFNTRDLNAVEGMFPLAVSTLNCADLSHSNLVPDLSSESLLDFDLIAFDHEVDLGNGVYYAQAGNDTGINFANEFTIGFAKSRDVTLTTPIGATNGAASPATGGLIAYNNSLTFEVSSSPADPTTLETSLVNGSVVRFSATGSDNYGFDLGDVYFDGPGLDPGEAVFGTPITIAGHTFYRTVDLYWRNGDTPLTDGLGLLIDVTVHYAEANPAGQMDLKWQLLLANHESTADNAPYTGPDQQVRCEPSFYPANEVSTWMMNTCQIAGVSLEGHVLTIEGNCSVGVDVYARDLDGNFTLIQAGVSVTGLTSLTLATILNDSYYGVVPAGVAPSDSNFIHTAVATVPTLTTWAQLVLILGLIGASFYVIGSKNKNQLPQQGSTHL